MNNHIITKITKLMNGGSADNSILTQQRSLNKPKSPGLLDLSMAGRDGTVTIPVSTQPATAQINPSDWRHWGLTSWGYPIRNDEKELGDHRILSGGIEKTVHDATFFNNTNILVKYVEGGKEKLIRAFTNYENRYYFTQAKPLVEEDLIECFAVQYKIKNIELCGFNSWATSDDGGRKYPPRIYSEKEKAPKYDLAGDGTVYEARYKITWADETVDYMDSAAAFYSLSANAASRAKNAAYPIPGTIALCPDELKRVRQAFGQRIKILFEKRKQKMA
ncbi:MAG: hypothetical protein FWC51_00340 [Proteobacteria bacterium]|nr:hypothetical protein [Pseudomonadota bacterium]